MAEALHLDTTAVLRQYLGLVPMGMCVQLITETAGRFNIEDHLLGSRAKTRTSWLYMEDIPRDVWCERQQTILHRDIFSHGLNISWDRILLALKIARLISEWAEHGGRLIVEDVSSCFTEYFDRYIDNWIEGQGGWESIPPVLPIPPPPQALEDAHLLFAGPLPAHVAIPPAFEGASLPDENFRPSNETRSLNVPPPEYDSHEMKDSLPDFSSAVKRISPPPNYFTLFENRPHSSLPPCPTYHQVIQSKLSKKGRSKTVEYQREKQHETETLQREMRRSCAADSNPQSFLDQTPPELSFMLRSDPMGQSQGRLRSLSLPEWPSQFIRTSDAPGPLFSPNSPDRSAASQPHYPSPSHHQLDYMFSRIHFECSPSVGNTSQTDENQDSTCSPDWQPRPSSFPKTNTRRSNWWRK